jgi:hypothetical protein
MADKTINVDFTSNTTDIDSDLDQVSGKTKSVVDDFGIMDTKAGKAFKTIVDGGKKAIASLTTVKGAVMATGIGALVLAVTALFQWFQKTEKGAQTLRVITAGLGQVMNELTDVVVNLGEFLFNLFANPKQAVIDFGNTLKDFIMGRIELLMSGISGLGNAIGLLFKGEFKEAAKTAGQALLDINRGVNPVAMAIEGVVNGVKAVGTAFKESAKDVRESISLMERENALRVRKREFMVQEAMAQRDINRLRSEQADRTLSIEEREAKLAEARALQDKLLQERLSQAKEELAIQEQRNALSSSTEADIEKEYELRATLYNLEAEAFQQAKFFETQLSAIRQERIDAENKAMEERMAKEQELAAFKLENEKAYLEQLRVLQEENYLASLETDEERRIAKIELEKQRFEEDLQRRLEEGRLTEEQLLTLQSEYNTKYLNALQAAKDKEVQTVSAAEQAKQEWARLTAEQQTMMALGAASAIMGLTTAVFGQGKASAAAEATINTYKAATSAYSAMAGIPIVGPALGAIAAMAAVAAGIANINKINSTPPPPKNNVSATKYATGGWVMGAMHSMGGVQAELEGGEYVVSRTAMQNPNIAAAVVSANTMGQSAQSITSTEVAMIAAQVVRAIPVNVVEEDISDKQRDVKIREEKFKIN